MHADPVILPATAAILKHSLNIPQNELRGKLSKRIIPFDVSVFRKFRFPSTPNNFKRFHFWKAFSKNSVFIDKHLRFRLFQCGQKYGVTDLQRKTAQEKRDRCSKHSSLALKIASEVLLQLDEN